TVEQIENNTPNSISSTIIDVQNQKKPVQNDEMISMNVDQAQNAINSDELNLSHPYPTDRGHFVNNISSELKINIIKFGSCKPKGPFSRDIKGRCFSTSYYFIDNNLKNLPRTWLCYSMKLNMAYCEPYWLFSDQNTNNNWKDGICDWQGLSKKIKIMKYQSVNFWKQVLKKLIDIIFTLSSSNISFRGHREVIGETNNGNYLSIVELLSRYDPILSKLVDKDNVKNHIILEILKCPFFSMICDTTQDITKQDQLSIVIRYVTEELDSNGIPCSLNINESCMGFTNITDQSAKGIEDAIMKDQGYDGASVMSGVYNGLQKRICEREPNAVYVHCAAHNLNLVLKDAVCVQPIQIFLDNIQHLYTFFSSSIKRWDLLLNVNSLSSQNNRSSSSKLEKIPTLKRLCPTRWSSRHDALF
ncbi:zinc finger MYM-type protein 1-like, partial [Aphis craccivora]